MRRPRRGRLVLIATVAVLLAAVGWLLASRRDDAGGASAVVIRSRLEQTIETTGVVEPAEPVVVHGAVPGTISLVAVRPGDRVERGDILMQFDRRPHEMAVMAARQALEAAELAESLAASHAALDGATPTADVLTMARDAAEARASLAAAERGLNASAVLAPAAGTVLQVEVAAGQPYEPGMPVATIAAADHLQVVARLDQIDLPHVRLGTPVQVIVDAYPEAELTGTIEAVAPSGTADGGGTIFPATVSVPDLGTIPAKPGMTVTLVIPSVVADQALIVPAEAIRTVGRRSFLTVLREGGASRVEIRTGLRANGLVEVTAGDVREGDRVRLEE